MSVSAPIVVVVAGVGYLLWRLLREYVVPSPLDNLSGPAPTSLITGNFPELTQRQSWKHWMYLNETYGPTYAMTGLLGEKMLQTYDPKATHSILIKDVELWPKRVTETDDFNMLLGPGLLTTESQQHRKQRKMLNPVFSAAHLRNMSHIFYDIAHKVQKAIARRVGKEPQEIDVNGWMARTTLEMLGQAGLGYSFDDFVSDSTDLYGESLKLFFPVLRDNLIWGLTMTQLSNFLPESALWGLSRLIPSATVHRMLNIGDTMARRSKEIVSEKKAALASGDDELVQRVGEGKDLMSILLKANTTATDTDKLTDEELIAQMSTFTLAGMDTTSNALSRILYLLAQHPTVQDKLRAEIQAAGGGSDGDDIAYDELVKLPYLDAVCRETLRVFAPVPLIGRRAARDMSLPLSFPVRGRDGSMISEVPVTRGTLVLLHIQASNTNKALWGEDAGEWRPERWLGQLPGKLEEARIPGVYSNLLSFSGGGRSCIGFKFSQLEMKVVLSVLLPVFKFELTDKPVAWNSSGVTYPTMGEESARPEMLLKVRRL